MCGLVTPAGYGEAHGRWARLALAKGEYCVRRSQTRSVRVCGYLFQAARPVLENLSFHPNGAVVLAAMKSIRVHVEQTHFFAVVALERSGSVLTYVPWYVMLYNAIFKFFRFLRDLPDMCCSFRVVSHVLCLTFPSRSTTINMRGWLVFVVFDCAPLQSMYFYCCIPMLLVLLLLLTPLLTLLLMLVLMLLLLMLLLLVLVLCGAWRRFTV